MEDLKWIPEDLRSAHWDHKYLGNTFRHEDGTLLACKEDIDKKKKNLKP